MRYAFPPYTCPKVQTWEPRCGGRTTLISGTHAIIEFVCGEFVMRGVLRRFVGLGAAISITAMASSATHASSSRALFSPDVAKQLDGAILEILKKDNLPSVAVRASVPGKGSYVFAAGLSDIGTRAMRVENQPFRIASITKTFVATAVLELVDRGRLRKTDLLAKWFPDFPNAGKITLDDLLRMRSGIAAPSDQAILEAIYDDPTMPAETLAQQMAEATKLRDHFKPPNQEGVYTNLNYYILGEIVARVAGQDVGQFIAGNIIRKLGLRQTSYPTQGDLPGGLHGYGWNPKEGRFDDKTRFNPALGGPAGAMISSLADLERYVRVLCTGGLLKPQTQRARMAGQALAETITQYGEGVITGPGACGHSGTVPGFSTDMYYLGKFDATLIVSVNRLDRDDVPRTLHILEAVSNLLAAQPGAR